MLSPGRTRKITLFSFFVFILMMYAMITSHETPQQLDVPLSFSDTRDVVPLTNTLISTSQSKTWPAKPSETNIGSVKFMEENRETILRQQSAAPTIPDRDSQENRLLRIERICNSTDVPGTVTKLFAYLPKNITYCHNFKSASTYWIQIFRFIHGDFKKHVDRPSQISKLESHLSPFKTTARLELLNMIDYHTVINSFRFMVSRDPYSRLWSVFVDKFVLLDLYFWNNYAPAIRRASDLYHKRKLQPVQCGNVTFSDMLTYIAVNGEKKPEDIEEHMRPIHYGCNPCIYKPNFIGKVETLTKEKSPILKRLGMEKYDDVYDFQSHVLNEMSMITEFEYELWRLTNSKSFRECLSQKYLEERMIRAFVINGYLPLDAQTILSDRLPLGKAKLTEAVSEIFRNSSRTAEEARQQRSRIRNKAFEDIPIDILHRLRNLYRYDFELFGYEPMPKYIFPQSDS